MQVALQIEFEGAVHVLGTLGWKHKVCALPCMWVTPMSYGAYIICVNDSSAIASGGCMIESCCRDVWIPFYVSSCAQIFRASLQISGEGALQMGAQGPYIISCTDS